MVPARKILIVDDDQEILDLLKANLERWGQVEVVTAGDPEEAKRKVVSEAPDLVVLDLVMPKGDGGEVLKFIRENPGTANIPVIISTVCREISTLIRLMSLGATDYLVKPYDIRELKNMLTLLLV